MWKSSLTTCLVDDDKKVGVEVMGGFATDSIPSKRFFGDGNRIRRELDVSEDVAKVGWFSKVGGGGLSRKLWVVGVGANFH